MQAERRVCRGGRRTTSDCHGIRRLEPESPAEPAECAHVLTGTAGRPTRGRPTYPRNHEGAKQCRGRGGARLLPQYADVTSHPSALPGGTRTETRCSGVRTVYGHLPVERRVCRRGGGLWATSDCREIRKPGPETPSMSAEWAHISASTAGRPTRGRPTYAWNPVGRSSFAGAGARLLA